MGEITATYRPFTWCLIEDPGRLPKWLGGNGRYGANVFMTRSKRGRCDYTIWKNRPRHKEGSLALSRGTAKNATYAKKIVELYIKNLTR